MEFPVEYVRWFQESLNKWKNIQYELSSEAESSTIVVVGDSGVGKSTINNCLQQILFYPSFASISLSNGDSMDLCSDGISDFQKEFTSKLSEELDVVCGIRRYCEGEETIQFNSTWKEEKLKFLMNPFILPAAEGKPITNQCYQISYGDSVRLTVTTSSFKKLTSELLSLVEEEKATDSNARNSTEKREENDSNSHMHDEEPEIIDLNDSGEEITEFEENESYNIRDDGSKKSDFVKEIYQLRLDFARELLSMPNESNKAVISALKSKEEPRLRQILKDKGYEDGVKKEFTEFTHENPHADRIYLKSKLQELATQQPMKYESFDIQFPSGIVKPLLKISDIPGTNDPSPYNYMKAKNTIEQNNKLLIVLTSDEIPMPVIEMLQVSKFLSNLLKFPKKYQIVFVVNREKQVETTIENLERIEDSTSELVSNITSQFREILINNSEGNLYIDYIIENLVILPVYPILFISLYLNTNTEMWNFLAQKNQSLERVLKSTNIPSLIGQFQKWQIEKLRSEIHLIDRELIPSVTNETNAISTSWNDSNEQMRASLIEAISVSMQFISEDSLVESGAIESLWPTWKKTLKQKIGRCINESKEFANSHWEKFKSKYLNNLPKGRIRKLLDPNWEGSPPQASGSFVNWNESLFCVNLIKVLPDKILSLFAEIKKEIKEKIEKMTNRLENHFKNWDLNSVDSTTKSLFDQFKKSWKDQISCKWKTHYINFKKELESKSPTSIIRGCCKDVLKKLVLIPSRKKKGPKSYIELIKQNLEEVAVVSGEEISTEISNRMKKAFDSISSLKDKIQGLLDSFVHTLKESLKENAVSEVKERKKEMERLIKQWEEFRDLLFDAKLDRLGMHILDISGRGIIENVCFPDIWKEEKLKETITRKGKIQVNKPVSIFSALCQVLFSRTSPELERGMKELICGTIIRKSNELEFQDRLSIVQAIFDGKDREYFSLILSTFEEWFLIPVNLSENGNLIKKAKDMRKASNSINFQKMENLIIQTENLVLQAQMPSPKLAKISFTPKDVPKQKKPTTKNSNLNANKSDSNSNKEKEKGPEQKKRKLYIPADFFD